MNFLEKYYLSRKKNKSVLSIGLDPILEKIPHAYFPDGRRRDKKNADPHSDSAAILAFLKDIIEYSAPYAIAYKANTAFFELLDPKFGFSLFHEIRNLVRHLAPHALFIADAKRGDISSSSVAYAQAFFQTLDCDAVTVHPYMGLEALQPFFNYRERAVMVLGHTSNPGALEFQGLQLFTECDAAQKARSSHVTMPLFLQVARAVQAKFHECPNLWLVVGATQSPESLAAMRKMAPSVPFLVPGIGTQGGGLRECLQHLGSDVLIHSGRSILYATEDRKALAQVVTQRCEDLLSQMRSVI